MSKIKWVRLEWDRCAGAILALAGAALLVIGWVGVRDKALPAQQLPYLLSGGIGGLFCLGAATALWLSADLRDEWRKLDRLEEALTRLAPGENGPDGHGT